MTRRMLYRSVISGIALFSCLQVQAMAPKLAGIQSAVAVLHPTKGNSVEGTVRFIQMNEFDDFKQALDFTNRVGEVAESEGHHPDIYLTWGKVELKVWTHKIDGLTESDFIFAAKADQAL
jgi:4a-hydroxytetrahydrobiopterin dehydratase